jgi:PqqD family protein of HPr-rel-A system
MLPKRRSDLETRTVDGELVILDLRGGSVHRLNATATNIWHDCDGVSTAADIAARLAARFHIEPAEVIGDVTAALAELEQLGLIVDASTA